MQCALGIGERLQVNTLILLRGRKVFNHLGCRATKAIVPVPSVEHLASS